MKTLVEVVESMVKNQYIFFITFYFAQFLFRKINEVKQLQN